MAKGSSKAKGSAVHLSWRTLGDLDNGMAGAVIDHALAAAVRDTEDRGLEDEKPRKVVIVGGRMIAVETIQSVIDRLTAEPIYQEALTQSLADSVGCTVTTYGRHGRFQTTCVANAKG